MPMSEKKKISLQVNGLNPDDIIPDSASSMDTGQGLNPADIAPSGLPRIGNIRPNAGGVNSSAYYNEGGPITGKQALAEAAPALVDIAATALAPQLKGVTWGVKGANLGIRALAAALGGGGGELIKQKMMGDETDLKKAGVQAAIGAGTEVVPSLVVSGFKKAKPALEMAADFTGLGKTVGRKASKIALNKQQQVKTLATDRALNFMESMTSGTPEIAGQRVGQAIKNVTDSSIAYGPWNDIVSDIAKKNKNEILLDDTAQYLGDLFKKFKNNFKTDEKALSEMASWLGYSGDKRTVNTLREILNDGYIGPNDAKYIMSSFWKKSFGKTTDKANTWKEGLKNIFLNDVEKQGVGAKSAKEFADKAHGAFKDFFRQSPGAQKIVDRMNFGKSDQLYYQGNPELVGKQIFKRQPDEIYQIRNAVNLDPDGEQAWNMLSMDYVRGIIESSFTTAKGSGKRVIYPAQLAEKLEAAGDRIKAAMPESWPRIKAEIDHFRQIAPQFDTLTVNEGFDIFESFAMLYPKGQNFVKEAYRAASPMGKPVIKIVGHSVPGQIDRLRSIGQSKPQLQLQ